MPDTLSATLESCSELQTAYDHFNARLFGGALPGCLLTLQRKKRTLGYFSKNRFVHVEGRTVDEIAMNPTYFASRDIAETLQTIVHEMAHQWQACFGTPGRGRYHNREWGRKMESIGLMPSNTGQPGGATTGDQMMDYVITGGAFEQACRGLLTENFQISWLDRFTEAVNGEGHGLMADRDGADALGLEIHDPVTAGENRSNRCKYSHQCQDDGIHNIWGKPGLNVFCGDCGQVFDEAGHGDEAGVGPFNRNPLQREIHA